MTTIAGLPAHVLLVHVVVVLVPLTALVTVLVTVWPAARARLAVASAVLAVVALVSVPLATNAGEWLEHELPRTDLIRTHTQLGDTLLPWAIGLTVIALAVAAREIAAARAAARQPVGAGAPAERLEPARWGGRNVTIALAVLAVIAAVGSVVMTYRIGDSGAQAVWQGVPLTPQPFGPGNGPPPGG